MGTVAIEGLADKYGEQARLDRQNWTVLKNKKVMGESLPAHRIQQRASSKIETMEESQTVRSKVPSAARPAGNTAVKPHGDGSDRCVSKIQPVTEIQPEFRVVAEPDILKPVYLRLTVELPGVRGGREVTLDVGEDRVVVSSTRLSYLLDIFLPYSLQPGLTQANFVKEQQKLEIRLSVQ